MTNVYPRRELDQRCRNLSALALLTLAADSAVFGQTASAKVTLGSEYCHPVHFQGGWRPTKGMKQAYQDHFMFGDPYEFRETARSTQEYLVAAVEHGKEYSPNKFWVNLRSGHVRDASPLRKRACCSKAWFFQNPARSGRSPGSKHEFRPTGD